GSRWPWAPPGLLWPSCRPARDGVKRRGLLHRTEADEHARLATAGVDLRLLDGQALGVDAVIVAEYRDGALAASARQPGELVVRRRGQGGDPPVQPLRVLGREVARLVRGARRQRLEDALPCRALGQAGDAPHQARSRELGTERLLAEP